MSDQKTRIYYNPNCSKCRLSLELLNGKDIEPEIIEYLKHVPDRKTLEEILGMLKIGPRELMRTGETLFKELGLDNNELTRDELINAMIENPVLIERPIIVKNGKAVIGRPPEKILDIL